MAEEAGRALLGLLRRRLVDLLDDARQALQLDGLGPVAGPWTGSGLEGHLLAAPGQAGAGDPVTAKVLDVLDQASVTIGQAEGGLFGWDPEPGGPSQARGIAYAIRTGDASQTAGPVLAAALAITSPSGARLELVASGTTTGTSAPALDFGSGWALRVDGEIAGVLRVGFGAEGDVDVSGGAEGDRLRIQVSRRRPAAGQGGGLEPGIDLGGLALTLEVRMAGGRPRLRGGLKISGGQVRLAPGDFSALLPALGPLPLDVELGVDGERGVDLAGSAALVVRLPTGASMPGISAGPLDVTLRPAVPVPDAVQVHVSTALGLDLPGLPIRLDLAGVGLELPFSLGGSEALGFDPRALVPIAPEGAGVQLDLPLVRGAGQVRRAQRGEYAGMLALRIPPVSLDAFGLLGLRPLSFLVVLGAAFPPPGIQIGFGFAITGLGGVVGVNRRVDREALAQAVADGSAAALLFPTDPSGQARQVMAALPGIFPNAPGRAVVGPMFQLSWGRFVSASLALLLELPDPVRVSILGKLVVAVPDPLLPLVQLQATFMGQVDPGEPSVTFQASLSGSRIAGIPLAGDVFLLSRGGAEAEFVLSAGGFHPRYNRPRGVPALARLGMDLSPTPLIGLRCAAYFAVTSNTVQFGARVELVAQVAGCGLRGHFAFDLLVQLRPLYFIAEVSAGVAVEIAGETLVGIQLSLALEGPTPWHARGRGSVDLFLFSASFDFDEVWGAAPPGAQLSTPDIFEQLKAAYADPASWTVRAPDPNAGPVRLAGRAARALGDGTVVHPQGSLSTRQRVLPLGVTVTRFDGLPVAPQFWDVADPFFRVGQGAEGTGEEREQFPPGQFLELTDDERLSRPAFESFKAGLGLTGDGLLFAEARGIELDYETKVVAGPEETHRLIVVGLDALLRPVETLAEARVADPLWWQTPDERIAVAAGPELAVADTWSFTSRGGAGTTVTEAHEFAGLLADRGGPVGVVESWEMTD